MSVDREQIRRECERIVKFPGLVYFPEKVQHVHFAQDYLALLAELEQAEADWPEGREGMAVVFDSVTRAYLGCIGIESWNILVLEGDVE